VIQFPSYALIEFQSRDFLLMISVAQIRAARGLIGWSQSELAEATGLSRPTIERAETKTASESTFAAIQRALEKAGVIFVDENGEGPGVRLKKAKRR
jgi:transcriptional regulator with XRE-family HTH domain